VDEVIKKRVEKQRPVRTDLVSISTLLSEDMNRLDEQTKNPNMTTGVSTGFVDLDSLVDGLHRGSVVVVGARPAMPKGSFVTNIACHVATNLGLPTVFFCPRTKATDITRKMTAQIANVEQARLLRAHLEASDWDRLSAAITRIHTAPLFVDDSPTLTVSDIREKCKHLKQQTGGIVLVVVDHLQALINPSIKDHASTIARELRALARELDVPILVTLAVSRVVDARPNRRPVERDLGEWSAFEDEADVLIFVYRDEAYNPESPDQGTVEIIVARNSYGQIATVRLNYDERVDAFSDFDGWGGGT
jgi:replicative DNA helicase